MRKIDKIQSKDQKSTFHGAGKWSEHRGGGADWQGNDVQVPMKVRCLVNSNPLKTFRLWQLDRMLAKRVVNL